MKKAVRQAEREAFIKNMPISFESSSKLFNAVDDALEVDSCHHDHRHTLAASGQLRLSPDAVLPWLKVHGGGCDCEVLNVEERVNEASGGVG